MMEGSAWGVGFRRTGAFWGQKAEGTLLKFNEFKGLAMRKTRSGRVSGQVFSLVGRIGGRLPLIALTLLLAMAFESDAQHVEPVAAGEPETGCGKAEAAQRLFAARGMVAEWRREYQAMVAAGLREQIQDTDLLHCDLEIEVVPGGSPNVIGTNTMTIRSNIDGLSVFTFRLRTQYVIANPVINGSTPITVSTLSTTTRQATLDQVYNTGDVFTLTIPYSGDAVSVGFGSISFTTHNGQPVVSSLSEPYYAYSWWPAKDGDVFVPGDNSDKFTADISIIAPDTMKSAANGVLVGVDDLGSRLRYRWSTTYPIATYLVAFSSTNYNEWTLPYTPIGGGMMPVLFYIYPEVDNPTNRTAWGRVVDMLTVLRDFYGEYPFVNEKYGIYNFPFGGGMEHQTFTGQGSSAFGEGITAHELGHQWWGDNVTCETWSDIWLNEGFATFTECLWEEYKTGSQNQPAYRTCMVSKTPSQVGNSVYVPAAETNDPNRIFSSTYTYRKAAWVLHQLRHVVGDATFFQILTDYRAAYEGSAAVTDDLVAVASSTYGQDLTWFFQQWVYQPGAPAYQYGWQSINIAGQNYLLVRIAQTHTTAGWPPIFTMPVDLVATIGGGPQTKTVWNDARTEWFVVPVADVVTALQFDPNQWILRTGATSTAYAPGPPKIVGTSPALGANVAASSGADQISITFHTNVNAAASHVSLVGANTGSKTFQLVSGSNVNPLVIQLDEPLVDDAYTLTVTSGVTAVNSGMTLDGEIADPLSTASLPSGDGLAGGNAVIQFTVSGTLAPGPATVSAAGGRYLAIDPGTGSDALALSVTPACPGGLTKYVGAPSGPFNAAALVGAAVYLTPAQWGATVYVTGLEIVPTLTYEVVADVGSPGNPELTIPVSAQTWEWGNSDNFGIVELNDLLCCLDGYNADFSRCSLYATDLAPDSPDQVVELADIHALLDAYGNIPYAGPSPCP